MPTYEYRCNDCGTLVEVFQRIDDEPPTACENCGGTLRKVFHPAGIVFKGSGFYATDSRSSAKKKQKAGESSSEKKSEGDAKPADTAKTSSAEKKTGSSGSSS